MVGACLAKLNFKLEAQGPKTLSSLFLEVMMKKNNGIYFAFLVLGLLSCQLSQAMLRMPTLRLGRQAIPLAKQTPPAMRIPKKPRTALSRFAYLKQFATMRTAKCVGAVTLVGTASRCHCIQNHESANTKTKSK